jgi:hypothetical protein
VPVELALGAAPDPALALDLPFDLLFDEAVVPELPWDGADPAGLAAAAPAAGIVAMVMAAGRVWNSSTPRRPTTVAVITIGARLTVPGLRW